MKTVEVLDGQTLVDIAAQELGDIDRVFEIAQLNEMNITDELTAGQEILVPDFEISKGNMVDLFADKANAPASSITESEGEDVVPQEGIDYWAIENDFVIQ